MSAGHMGSGEKMDIEREIAIAAWINGYHAGRSAPKDERNDRESVRAYAVDYWKWIELDRAARATPTTEHP